MHAWAVCGEGREVVAWLLQGPCSRMMRQRHITPVVLRICENPQQQQLDAVNVASFGSLHQCCVPFLRRWRKGGVSWGCQLLEGYIGAHFVGLEQRHWPTGVLLNLLPHQPRYGCGITALCRLHHQTHGVKMRKRRVNV